VPISRRIVHQSNREGLGSAGSGPSSGVGCDSFSADPCALIRAC
jgi:hypothetical protein